MPPTRSIVGAAWLSILLGGASPALAIRHHPELSDEEALALADLPEFRGSGRVHSGPSLGSGLLIADRWVLTAKHLFSAPVECTFFWIAGRGYYAASLHPHPTIDLGLILLEEAVPGCLVTAPYAWSNEVGEEGWKIGYGAHGPFGEPSLPPDGRDRASTNVVAGATVTELYYRYDGPPPAGTVYEGGTAPGDSGGPFMVFARDRWWVAGITSGPRSGFYADGRVSPAFRWIEKTTGLDFALPVAPTLRARWVAGDLLQALPGDGAEGDGAEGDGAEGDGAEGDIVEAWPARGSSRTFRRDAGARGGPTLVPFATPSGKAAVRFDGLDDRLELPPDESPIAGTEAFSVALVVSAEGAGAGGESQWWENTGILDAEEPGAARDWGLAVSGGGKAAFGIGDPDTTLYGLAPGAVPLSDGAWHVVVATWDGSEISGDGAGSDQNMALYVDDAASAVRGQGAEFSNVARSAAAVVLGGCRGMGERGFSGLVAEVRAYRGALGQAAVRSLLGALRDEYLVERGGLQRRGDCNQDGALDLSDALCLLQHLFLRTGDVLPCGDGTLGDAGNVSLLDSSGDGGVDLSDAAHLLGVLFLGADPGPSLSEECVWIAGCPAACRR